MLLPGTAIPAISSAGRMEPGAGDSAITGTPGSRMTGCAGAGFGVGRDFGLGRGGGIAAATGAVTGCALWRNCNCTVG